MFLITLAKTAKSKEDHDTRRSHAVGGGLATTMAAGAVVPLAGHHLIS